MLPDPMHPAIVHFPIVFVVVLPFVAAAALFVIHRGADARRSWLPVLAVATALSASAWLALQTGGREEEVVEDVVPESAIHQHEETAELFLGLSVAFLALVAVGLVHGRAGTVARTVAPAAAVVLLVTGYRVGHTGGELVYRHDAASVYAQSSSGQRALQEREGSSRDDDDGRSDDDR